MKIKILVTVSDDINCADFYVHTGGQQARSVSTYEREVEIPDQPGGWGILSIERLITESGKE